MSIDKHGFLGSQMETWIKEYRKCYSPYFALANEVNEFCQASMLKFPVHNRDDQEMLAATLYMRILSNYQSVILLCERGMMPEARAMLRVMLEAIFSLCAIAKDPQLANDFIREHYSQRLKFLKKFRKLHGEQLPPDVNPHEIEELERQLKTEKHKLKVRRIEDWAEEAELTGWYLTAYAVLSDSVHSNVGDLDRYFVKDEKGNATEFRWGPDDEGMKINIVTAIEGILIALRCAVTLFELEKNEMVDEFRRRVQQLHLPSSSNTVSES